MNLKKEINIREQNKKINEFIYNRIEKGKLLKKNKTVELNKKILRTINKKIDKKDFINWRLKNEDLKNDKRTRYILWEKILLENKVKLKRKWIKIKSQKFFMI